MSNIKTISPIHISSGNKYIINYIDENGYVFSMEDIIMANPSSITDDLLKNDVCDKNQDLFKDIIQNDSEENGISISKGKLDDKKGLLNTEVNEAIKTLNKLYIPGSTLKGYIINVAWNYIIRNNESVRQYFIGILKEFRQNSYRKKEYIGKIKNLFNNPGIKKVQSIFGVRDVAFDGFDIKFIMRIKKEKQKKPNKQDFLKTHIEVISKDTISSDGEIVFFNNYLNFNEIIKLCSNEGKEQENIRKTAEIVVKSFFDFFKDFDGFCKWFPMANKQFIKGIIMYEQEFIRGFTGQGYKMQFSNNKLNCFYKQLKDRLEKGEIIIRIGKNTNYLLKTISTAFGEEDLKLYFDIFSPAKSKKDPEIKSSFFYSDNGNAMPLGYALIEL